MSNPNSVTVRAVLLGMLLAVLVNLGPTYSGYIVGSSWSDFGHLPLVTLLLFMVLTGFCNVLAKVIRPEWALKPPELLVIFVMGWIAALMQGEWLGGYFLGVISAPNYFVSPENQWTRHILHNIPDWLILSDKGHAAQWFYEGLPPGQPIPWMVWVVPIFWWFSFFGVLIFVCFCLAVILRKQWVENEKLRFPLAEIPLMLMKRSKGSFLPDFARTRVFWIGFFLPIAIICWNISSWFNPLFPNIPLIVGYNTFPRIVIATGYPEIFAKIDAYVIPFAFLTRMDVLFSVWFFYLLAVLQVGLFSRVGYSIGTADPWSSFDAATGWQSFGGFLVLVVWGFWMARRHLKNVLRKALSGTTDIDDTEELLSYRVAVLGTVLGVFYLFWWLHRA
ncbi:MAG TPA: hypothetical protein EYP19_17260, partial [Desulfobacterales bacterium]|nr:hypothetical protein [Desulfobacterales bacterium]